jgi:hypothetical protein
MQTLAEAPETEGKWLVKLVAGLPGGIGNTGYECGGITSPLVLLGLERARDPLCDGLPVVVYKGHELLAGLSACHNTTSCRTIRGDDRLPLRCIGVIRRTPEQYVEATARECAESIPQSSRAAYSSLYAHWCEKRFHCAHHVFRQLDDAIPVTQDLLDATSGFVGGTVFTGMTCGAFTAGVMALGLLRGEIEHSRLRVLRMIGRMIYGGDAFADDLNAFNRVMNLGHRLSTWFVADYGSTQCRAITQCDFAKSEDVQRYIDADCVARCAAIGSTVAAKIRSLAARHTA